MSQATNNFLLSSWLHTAQEVEGGFSGDRSGSQAPEPEARRFGSRHVNGVKRPCQHGMQAYECTKCKDKAAAANEDDPARCALPPTLSPLVSPREPLDSPGMAGPAAPPRTFLEPIDEKNFRTDISTWCPGAAAPNPMPSTLARKRSSETIPAPAPVLQAAAPTAAFSLIYADGYSSRSSSACGSHLHNLLQGGSRSSLPSAASATSTTCTRTEVQLLVSQLADAEERNAELEARNASLSRAKAYLSRANASLSRANASLSHENDRLRQGHQQLDHMTVVLDNSVLRNEAEVQRKDDTIEMLRRQVQELEGQVKELEATARASPTTSPPSDSMRERALKAQGAITVEVQQRFCGHTGMTDIGVLLKGVDTDPLISNPATHVELLKAEPLSAASCTSSGSGSSPTAYLPGTKSVWKVRDYVQEQQQQKQQQQQQQQQKRKLKQKQQQRQKQASVATVPTYIAKVTPFHSPERIEELQQGTFTAAHAGSGRIMTVPVPWSEAFKELITTTAMDRAARHCAPGAHGPFLVPLQHLVRPCSQVGGPLDVGYDLELVVLYEYCAGGDAVEVVEEAVGAVLRLGGSVKEAAAAGAEVAWGATAASLRQMQIVHKLGCVVSDHKPTNMVYHPDLGWVLIDAEGAVLLGPDGRVPGRGCHTDFYGAPEQMRQEDPYRSRESDVWAVGRTAKALVLLVEEACRAAAEQQHEGDWVAVVHEGMGQALGKLQSLEAMCCAQEPSKRATLEKAREMLGV